MILEFFYKDMSKEKKKILIIEDEEMIRTMYEMKLKQDGFLVTSACNGAEGLDVIKQEKFDLILLDIIMPQIDGFAVLDEIRNGDSKCDTPVVMLTNLSTEDDRAKGEKLGATGYLVKSSMTPSQMSKEILQFL